MTTCDDKNDIKVTSDNTSDQPSKPEFVMVSKKYLVGKFGIWKFNLLK